MYDPVAFWRHLRLAVKQAHALGAEFRIRGEEVEIGGIDRLPDKLRAALNPELLREYVGAAEDDDEATEFLDKLGAEAVLVDTVADAAAAQDEIEAQKAAFIGIDIETIASAEYASRAPVKVNVDGSIGKNTKDLAASSHRYRAHEITGHAACRDVLEAIM